VPTSVKIVAAGHKFTSGQQNGDSCAAKGATMTCTLRAVDTGNGIFGTGILLYYSQSDPAAQNGSCGITLAYQLFEGNSSVASGSVTQTQAGGGCG
jgi:hypothetical protein